MRERERRKEEERKGGGRREKKKRRKEEQRRNDEIVDLAACDRFAVIRHAWKRKRDNYPHSPVFPIRECG